MRGGGWGGAVEQKNKLLYIFLSTGLFRNTSYWSLSFDGGRKGCRGWESMKKARQTTACTTAIPFDLL